MKDLKARCYAELEVVMNMAKSKDEALLFKTFFEKLIANKLSWHRIMICLKCIKRLLRIPYQTPMTEWDRNHVNGVVLYLQQDESISEATRYMTLIVLRKLLQHRFGYEYHSKEYPEIVKWLKIRPDKRKLKQLKASDILTKDEVLKLIKAAYTLRDKTIIALMFEAGLRSGELLGMKVGDVSFENIETNQGNAIVCMIAVNGKTGFRQIPLIETAPLLKDYLRNHPQSDNPDAPLWFSLSKKNRFEKLEYDALRKMLKDVSKRAGIKKKVYPHIFRHSSATYYSKILTDQQLKLKYGWTNDSRMLNVYSHLTSDDLKDKLLDFMGLKKKEESNNSMTPRFCKVCGHENSFEFEFCQKCNHPLTDKAVKQLMEAREKREKDLIERIAELERAQAKILEIINSNQQIVMLMLETYKKLKKGEKVE
jgi:integrase